MVVGTFGLSLLFHPLRGRRPRRGHLAAHVRVHLLGGARDRLHDLPDEPRARGGARTRHSRGHAAGIILAGTFSVLMTLPVTFTFNLGFMVALGILLDTFVVRTIMVPAAVELLSDKVWWPSGPGGGARAIGEAPAPEAPAREPARAS